MTITPKEVEAEIRRLAAESPDNVYRGGEDAGCLYTLGTCTNGSKGCIVGQALCRLGFEEQCKEMDRSGGQNADDMLRACNILGDYRWINTVQGAQDEEMKWGEAVELAEVTK